MHLPPDNRLMLMRVLSSAGSCSHRTASCAAVTAGQPLHPSCLLYLLPCRRLCACRRCLLTRVLCPGSCSHPVGHTFSSAAAAGRHPLDPSCSL